MYSSTRNEKCEEAQEIKAVIPDDMQMGWNQGHDKEDISAETVVYRDNIRV